MFTCPNLLKGTQGEPVYECLSRRNSLRITTRQRKKTHTHNKEHEITKKNVHIKTKVIEEPQLQ